MIECFDLPSELHYSIHPIKPIVLGRTIQVMCWHPWIRPDSLCVRTKLLRPHAVVASCDGHSIHMHIVHLHDCARAWSLEIPLLEEDKACGVEKMSFKFIDDGIEVSVILWSAQMRDMKFRKCAIIKIPKVGVPEYEMQCKAVLNPTTNEASMILYDK